MTDKINAAELLEGTGELYCTVMPVSNGRADLRIIPSQLTGYSTEYVSVDLLVMWSALVSTFFVWLMHMVIPRVEKLADSFVEKYRSKSDQ